MRGCQGPSHGGSYIDEGTSHIRIGLSLLLFQGTILLLLPAPCSICWSFAHVWCQMIQGCTSTLPPLVPHSCMRPWGLSFLIMCASTFLIVRIPWWTMHQAFTMDYSPHVCWCSMGFITILLLLAIVLRSWYFGYWYDNTGRCGL